MKKGDKVVIRVPEDKTHDVYCMKWEGRRGVLDTEWWDSPRGIVGVRFESGSPVTFYSSWVHPLVPLSALEESIVAYIAAEKKELGIS